MFGMRFMFRLLTTVVFISIFSSVSFAQPPVMLAGPPEPICETDLHLDVHGSCPMLPLAGGAIVIGGAEDVAVLKPKGFEVVYAVAAQDDERGEGFYVFGEVAGRNNAPYLAFAPKGGLAVPESWEFFTGRGLSGSVNWVGFNRWQRHTDADGMWNPGEKAKVFSPEKLCGKFQVEWNVPLGRWLMLYDCGGAAWVRVAQQPSGPWSGPTMIADASENGGRILLPNLDAAGPADTNSRSTAIYWGVSLGYDGHYQVMRAVLRQEGAQ